MLVAGNFSDPAPGMGWFLHCKSKAQSSSLYHILNPSAPLSIKSMVCLQKSLPKLSCVVATRLELEQLGIAYNELTRLLTLIPDSSLGEWEWSIVINEFLGMGVLWYVMIQDWSNPSCSRMSQRAVGMRWRDSTHAQQKPQEVSGNTRGAASDGAWWSHAMTC